MAFGIERVISRLVRIVVSRAHAVADDLRVIPTCFVKKSLCIIEMVDSGLLLCYSYCIDDWWLAGC
jgi:hypothetical protein